MDNAQGEVEAAKAIASSDSEWFQSLLLEDLFEPTCTTYDESNCSWLGDPLTCSTDAPVSSEDYLVAKIQAFDDGSELGFVTVEKEGDDFKLTLTDWALVGQTDQGVHIYEGNSCASAEDTGGHYFSGSTDPWTTGSTYTSDNTGAVSCGAGVACSGPDNNVITISGVGKTMLEVANHALVVHAGDEKVGCGILAPCSSIAATAYDSYSSAWIQTLECDNRAKCSITGSGRPDTMPQALMDIGNQWLISKRYESFSCTRNIPECNENTAALENCEAKCEAVNQVIGNFAAVCETARASETESGQGCAAIGGANCVLTPAPKAWEDTSAKCVNITTGTATTWEDLSTEAACANHDSTIWVPESSGFCLNTLDIGSCTYNPPSFTCYTLANTRNIESSCTGTGDPATGETNWCNTERQRGIWGQSTCPGEGCPAAGMAQGWKRDCPMLCREYQQNAPPAPTARSRSDAAAASVGLVVAMLVASMI